MHDVAYLLSASVTIDSGLADTCRCPGCLTVCLLTRSVLGMVDATDVTLKPIASMSMTEKTLLWERISGDKYAPQDRRTRDTITALFRASGTPLHGSSSVSRACGEQPTQCDSRLHNTHTCTCTIVDRCQQGIRDAEARLEEAAALKAAAAQQADGADKGKRKKKASVPKQLAQAAQRTAAGKSPQRRGRKTMKRRASPAGDKDAELAGDNDSCSEADISLGANAPWAV